VSIHKSLFLALLLVLTAALITACCCGGGSTSSTDFDELFEDLNTTTTTGSTEFGASCDDSTSLSQCSEYTKGSMELLGEDFYKGMCELTSGKWSTGKCPTENLTGTCDDGAGGVTYYYSTGDLQYSAESAKSSCDLLGSTWKAGS